MSGWQLLPDKLNLAISVSEWNVCICVFCFAYFMLLLDTVPLLVQRHLPLALPVRQENTPLLWEQSHPTLATHVLLATTVPPQLQITIHCFALLVRTLLQKVRLIARAAVLAQVW